MAKALPPRQRKKLRSLEPRLREDPLLGTHIARRLVPLPLSYLPNLYRLALPGGWRALYTIKTNGRESHQARIIWAGDHTAYDHLFGYH